MVYLWGSNWLPGLGLVPRIPILLSASSRDNVGEHNNLAASV